MPTLLQSFQQIRYYKNAIKMNTEIECSDIKGLDVGQNVSNVVYTDYVGEACVGVDIREKFPGKCGSSDASQNFNDYLARPVVVASGTAPAEWVLLQYQFNSWFVDTLMNLSQFGRGACGAR